MLSSVLRSRRAVEVNIAIMRTFVQLRRLIDSNRDFARKTTIKAEIDHDAWATLNGDTSRPFAKLDQLCPRVPTVGRRVVGVR